MNPGPRAPDGGSQSRQVALGSLGLLALYGAVIGIESAASGTSFGQFEVFPLATTSEAGLAARFVALLLGLALGWGVPGLSLAFLWRRPTQATALLSRALGLGFGYIVLTGLAYAAVMGNAPHRAVFLVILALPSIVLGSRPVRGLPPIPRLWPSVAVVVAGIAVVVIALWPNLRQASLNGDGTEVYELARSLEDHRFPHWDLEGEEPSGRFGIPATVPFFTGAYLSSGEMAILGRGELAVRLPFVFSLILLAVTAVGLVQVRTAVSVPYTAATVAVFALWHAFYVTYEPAFPEIAAAAGSHTLTIALWLAGFRELLRGSARLGAAFIVLASGVTYAAPVLAVLAVGFLCLFAPDRLRSMIRTSAAAVAVAMALVMLLGWVSGDIDAWWRQIRSEYLQDYVSEPTSGLGLALSMKLMLISGAIPILAPFVWRRLDGGSRVLWLTGALYFALVLTSGQKHLHYISPLPWLFLPAGLEIAARSRWLAAGAVVVLAVAFGLSWPAGRTVRTDSALLGREACVVGLSYEAASAGSDGIYRVLEHPPRTARFAVGKHTFVRYAMDLGGQNCVIGLSRTRPKDAVTVLEGPLAFWTRDINRYAHWRFHQVRPPTSPLFPADPLPEYSSNAGDWTGPIDLAREPGRTLRLFGFRGGDGPATLEHRGGVLVPLPGTGDRIVVIRLIALSDTSLETTVNDGSPVAAHVRSGAHDVPIPGDWRAGWNILRLSGTSGTILERITVR